MIDHPSQSTALGTLLRARRQQLGLSLRDVAERAGIDRGRVSQLENGPRSAKPPILQGLASALELPLADLYEAAGYPLPGALPSLRPYLRHSYGVSDEAVDEIERYLARISPPYTPSVPPKNGEDELPE